jgi:class 3 adenylate cyclase/tetratricopeptide (TPR) repeat protein
MILYDARMKCAGCGEVGPPGARFCAACGARLVPACAACGTELPSHARFCPQCGQPSLARAAVTTELASPATYTPKHLVERILISKAALEGERKQVTVLFVDVSGFTALSARLDPEDVHALMTRAFELMLAEVHRFEGTVNQFLGDGIMALFGAPLAHEDHAQRAVRAALGIQRALEDHRRDLERERGMTFKVRQGLNSGLVVVGSIGSDLRMDYTAVGDTTNVAARLQQAAAPGSIVIGEATYRLVADYFETRPLGALSVHGKPDPIRAWVVEAAREGRTRLDAGAQRGLTPLVGREREIETLETAFARTRAGQGQVVFVVGEPGIGKSRLLYEFRGRAADADWREGHCLSFGRATAFHPLVDLLKRWVGIDERDADDVAVAKVEGAVAALGDDLRAATPSLRYLLSLGPADTALATLDPRERRGGIFEALRRMILRAAVQRPQIVVIEDLHWIDRATEEFLALLGDSVPASRVLLVFTYRPGYAQPFGERTYHTRIVPAPLSEPESARMAATILSSEALPDTLRSAIAAKTEGNPFYVEEVVRSLHEAGAIRVENGRFALTARLDDVVIPDTIHDVIMARIDRLEEAPKRTLQTASVIGRDFTRRLVERLSAVRDRSDALLRELRAVELIYEKSVFPEVAYRFKHALTQDVAYRSLLVQRRRELHGLIGAAIEELYADRLAEHYEVLAHHFFLAEDWPRALDYLLKAGEKAAAAFALRDALALYDQALSVAERLGDALPATARMAIHQAKSSHAFFVGDFSQGRAEGERWLALAEGTGDRAAAAAALAWTSFATMWAQDFGAASDYARRAIAVGGAADVPAAVSGGYLTIAYVNALSGRHDEAGSDFDEALRVSRIARDPAREILTLQMRGVFDGWHGDYLRAHAGADEAVNLARDHGLLVLYLRSLWTRGLASTSIGDWDGALGDLEEGAAVADRIGDRGFMPRMMNTLGWLHIECDDIERGIDVTARAAALARDIRHAYGVEMYTFCTINLGDAFLARGDLGLAGDAFDEAQRIADDPQTHEWMKWRYTLHLHASLGEYWLARGDRRRAVDFAERSLRMSRPTRSLKYVARALRLLGDVARLDRRWEDAERSLRESAEIARAIAHPNEIWKTELAVARVHAAAGRRDAAAAALGGARRTIEELRGRVRDPRLLAGLTGGPLIRGVFDASPFD